MTEAGSIKLSARSWAKAFLACPGMLARQSIHNLSHFQIINGHQSISLRELACAKKQSAAGGPSQNIESEHTSIIG